jgi:hypothetical protein
MIKLLAILALLFCKHCISVQFEQIALAYSDDTSEVVVTFAAYTSESTAEVFYGSSATNLENKVSASGSTYSVGDYTSPMLFSATMKGLTEGNKIYFYFVGSETLGYTDIKAFKTHPGIGTKNVTFHIFADIGQTDNSLNTLNELVEFENSLTNPSGGIFCIGDLSYADSDEPRWDSFGRLKESAASTIPMLSAVGNHEWFDSSDYSFQAYLARYYNPSVNGKRELYYSYDAGLVHWVIVAGYCQDMTSISTQPCLADGSPQRAWLENDLATVNRTLTPWVIVLFHEPYVNSNKAHDIATEGLPMQLAIEDILYANKVDLVFSGHVHAYERSCQVYKYECVDGAPYYITIGDGGNREGLATTWVMPQPKWSLYRQASYGFGELQVIDENQMVWRWHQNSDLVPVISDEFVFTKDSSRDHWSEHITGRPVFANTLRGYRGEAFNEVQSNKYRRGQEAH